MISHRRKTTEESTLGGSPFLSGGGLSQSVTLLALSHRADADLAVVARSCKSRWCKEVVSARRFISAVLCAVEIACDRRPYVAPANARTCVVVEGHVADRPAGKRSVLLRSRHLRRERHLLECGAHARGPARRRRLAMFRAHAVRDMGANLCARHPRRGLRRTCVLQVLPFPRVGMQAASDMQQERREVPRATSLPRGAGRMPPIGEKGQVPRPTSRRRQTVEPRRAPARLWAHRRCSEQGAEFEDRRAIVLSTIEGCVMEHPEAERRCVLAIGRRRGRHPERSAALQSGDVGGLSSHTESAQQHCTAACVPAMA